jgi:hypothetical protein
MRSRSADRPCSRRQGRFPVRAVWRASGPANPAVDVALAALGDAHL